MKGSLFVKKNALMFFCGLQFLCLTGCPLFTGCSSKTKKVQPKSAEVKVDENLKAPEKFDVKIETTKGSAILHVQRAWSPNGADRFYQLVKGGFFTDVAYFRVLNGFVAQWGIHGDPEVSRQWREKTIQDDPVKESNQRGTVSFATGGPNTRTTQLFVNFRDNSNLDGMGFSPIGKFDDEGMEVMDALYDEYGEGAPSGNGPAQHLIQAGGNDYLKEKFPKLDYVKSMTVVQ